MSVLFSSSVIYVVSTDSQTLEEELLDHSEVVMDMITEYDATEIKLVKLRRQRDFKR
jgi:hypothetical protein